MKKIGLICLIVLVFAMPVHAQTIKIPDVTGLAESEAIKKLEDIILPDGNKLEIIKEYAYRSDVSSDVVYEQSSIGENAVEELNQVKLFISMGEEPQEILDLEDESAGDMSTFGLANYLNVDAGASNSQFGINWDSLPASYEYGWDNSMMCWEYGVWIDGVCYKTPYGEYSTDVRHKVQIYCDGTYVYTRIVFARDFWTTANGDNYRYFFDGEEAIFQFVGPGGSSLTDESKTMGVGTSQVGLVHSNGQASGQPVNGSMAYLTKPENGVNAELEAKFPLSEVLYQNPAIDMDNLGKIEFSSPNLMYRNVTATGADTLPFLTAGICLLMIPGSTLLLAKYHQKRKQHEQKV